MRKIELMSMDRNAARPEYGGGEGAGVGCLPSIVYLPPCCIPTVYNVIMFILSSTYQLCTYSPQCNNVTKLYIPAVHLQSIM